MYQENCWLEVNIKNDEWGSDPIVGFFKILAQEVIELNGAWWNKVAPLDASDNVKKVVGAYGAGKLYLQMIFAKEGIEIKDSPPILEDISADVIKKNEKIDGIIKINLVKAIDLPGVDSGKADPFVKIHYPDGKSEESDVIKNQLNPVWNKMFNHPLKIERSVFLTFNLTSRN